MTRADGEARREQGSARSIAVMAVAAAAVIAVTVLWPNPLPAPPAPAAAETDAIATVGGRPLTLADVGVQIERLGAATPREAHAAILAALNEKVDGDLMAEEAARLGITVEQVVRAQVRVTPAEVEAYAAEHHMRYRTPDRYRLRGIFVSSPTDAAPAHAEAALARIDRAKAMLAKRRPFDQVARELSDGIEGSSGGALGDLARDQPPLDDPKLSAAVSALKDGGVTDVIRTGAGYWILRLESHLPPADPPFAEIQPRAKADLIRERAAKLERVYLDGLRARADVKILLPPPDDAATGPATAVKP